MTTRIIYNFHEHYYLIHIGFQLGRLEFIYKNQNFDEALNQVLLQESNSIIADINSYLKKFNFRVDEGHSQFSGLMNDLVSKIKVVSDEAFYYLMIGMSVGRYKLAKARNPISEELLNLSENCIEAIPSTFILDKTDFFELIKKEDIDSSEKMHHLLQKINSDTNKSEYTSKKIFLVSSSELSADRKDLREFISVENDELHKQGKYIELKQWEYANSAVSLTRKQDDYNSELQNSDIVICLFGTKVGKYSEEEFDAALSWFKKTGSPQIYTYFKNINIHTGQLGEEFYSVINFKKKLDVIGHFPDYYEHIDQLKYKIKIQLEKYW